MSTPMMGEDPEAGVTAMLRAIRVSAEKAAASQDAREVRELGQAALAFAQAIVVLDPGLTNSGVPLDHELEMEKTRQDGMARLEAQRAKAAAPTPARRSVKVNRDASGNATSYETEG